MKIAAITRFKHGALFQALQKLGWTQTRLAAEVGVSPHAISLIACMKRRPSRKLSDRIMMAFGDRGMLLDLLSDWPENFYAKESVAVQFAEVPAARLLEQSQQLRQIEYLDQIDREKIVGEALACLTEREKYVVDSTFYQGKAQSEIAQELSLTTQAISYILKKALGKLRRPAIRKHLMEVY